MVATRRSNAHAWRARAALIGLTLLGCGGQHEKAPFVPATAHGERDAGSSGTGASRPRGGSSDMDAAKPSGRRDAAIERDGTAASDASTGTDATVAVDDTGSKTITAAEGATVCLPSGRACLTFAPNALARDTVVTLRRVASPYGVPDWGLRIEPESLHFSIAPELRIDVTTIVPPVPYVTHTVTGYAPDSPPPTFRWNGTWRRDGRWLLVDVPQPGFCAVTWETVGLPEGCSMRPSVFTACGGDLTGSWQLEGLCYDEPFTILYEGWDFDDDCPAIHSLVDQWPMDASLQVTGDHLVQQAATALIPLHATFDLSCKYSPADNCTDLGPAVDFGKHDVTCSGSAASCECTYVAPSSLPAMDATVTTGATTLSVGSGPAKPYCVEGSRMRVLEGAGGTAYVAQYRRAP